MQARPISSNPVIEYTGNFSVNYTSQKDISRCLSGNTEYISVRDGLYQLDFLFPDGKKISIMKSALISYSITPKEY